VQEGEKVVKRHAILIASPKLKDHDALPGTLADVANMRGWLLSNQGGAWEPGEIKTFTNPSYEELNPYLQLQSGYDYVINLFAGHGYMVPADYGTDTVACLRDGVDLRVKMLNPGNKRCTVLADCCRKLHVNIPPELVLEARAEKTAVFASDDRARCRALFDKHVMAAEEGAVYLYSCGKNQTAADDDAQGGLFTYNFIRSAREWASYQPQNAVMQTNRTFKAAKDRTTRMEPQQHPEMGGVRRLTFFPFAVK